MKQSGFIFVTKGGWHNHLTHTTHAGDQRTVNMAYRTPPPVRVHRRLSPPDPQTWTARKGDVAIESSLGDDDRSLPGSPQMVHLVSQPVQQRAPSLPQVPQLKSPASPPNIRTPVAVPSVVAEPVAAAPAYVPPSASLAPSGVPVSVAPNNNEELLSLVEALGTAKADALHAQRENDRLRNSFVTTLAERDMQWEAKVQRERHQIATVIDTIEAAARHERRTVQEHLASQSQESAHSTDVLQSMNVNVESALQNIASKCSTHVAELQGQLVRLAENARQAVEDRDKVISLKEQEVLQLSEQTKIYQQQQLSQVMEQYQQLQCQMQLQQVKQQNERSQGQMQALQDTLQHLTSASFLSGRGSNPATPPVATPPVATPPVATTPQMQTYPDMATPMQLHHSTASASVSEATTSLPSVKQSCLDAHPWGRVQPQPQQQQQQQSQPFSTEQQVLLQRLLQQVPQQQHLQQKHLEHLQKQSNAMALLQQIAGESSPPLTPHALPQRSNSIASHASNMLTEQGFSQLQRRALNNMGQKKHTPHAADPPLRSSLRVQRHLPPPAAFADL